MFLVSHGDLIIQITMAEKMIFENTLFLIERFEIYIEKPML